MPDNDYDSRNGGFPDYNTHANFRAAVDASNQYSRARSYSGIDRMREIAAAKGYYMNDDGTIDLEPDEYQKKLLAEQKVRHARMRAEASVDWDRKLIEDVAEAVIRSRTPFTVDDFDVKRGIVFNAIRGPRDIYTGSYGNGNKAYQSEYAYPEEIPTEFVLKVWHAAGVLTEKTIQEMS